MENNSVKTVRFTRDASSSRELHRKIGRATGVSLMVGCMAEMAHSSKMETLPSDTGLRALSSTCGGVSQGLFY